MTIRLEDLNRYIGKMVAVEGDTITELPAAPADAAFPIVCSKWEQSKRERGARQARCTSCKEFIGVSPNGWAIHLVNPVLRPLFCNSCGRALMELLAEQEGH